MRQLKVDKLLGPDACRERQLVLAMIAARIVDPRSKLSTATCLNATTLPELLDARDATEDELYAAMDWLLERQDSVEKKLGKRHLREGAMALYDLTSSYFEGTHCPLAARGYSRDGKKRKLQVNYGLLTDRRGCPVLSRALDDGVAVRLSDGNGKKALTWSRALNVQSATSTRRSMMSRSTSLRRLRDAALRAAVAM